MPRVTVPLDPPYDVVVGRGAIGELRALLPASTRRAAVVTQPASSMQRNPTPTTVAARGTDVPWRITASAFHR